MQPEVLNAGSLHAVVIPPQKYYEQDGVTIYCGDNRRIVPLLGGYDLLLTDPPYGIGFAAQPTTGQRRREQKRETWDNAPAAAWMIDLAREKCERQIIWGGNYYNLPAARCWLSWHKPDAPPSMGNVEYAWTNLEANSRQISQSIAATNAERVGHPTQKPLRVIQFALQQAGPATSVLDPWSGSGTTLLACKLSGIEVTGIEINEEYCELAVRRLRQGVLLAV